MRASALFAVYAATMAIGLWLPILNLVFLMAVAAPLSGGLWHVQAALLAHERPGLYTLTRGFGHLDRWVGAVFCLLLHGVLPLLPFLFGILIAAKFPYAEWRWQPSLWLGGLSALLMAAVFTRWIFVLPLATQVPREWSTSELFARSARAVAGRTIPVATGAAGLFVIGLSGLLIGGVGILISAPIALLAWQSWALALDAAAQTSAASSAMDS